MLTSSPRQQLNVEHALEVTIPISIHGQKTSTYKIVLKGMPKAATLYIPGSFKHICLVIVDVDEASFPPTEHFYIGNSDRASFTGNDEFAKIAHKLIGRNSEKPAVPLSMTDCFAAWKVMCKGLLSYVNPAAIEMQIAVLATSRFGGFSVWPDVAKAEKADSFAVFASDLGVEELAETLDEWMNLLVVAENVVRGKKIEAELDKEGVGESHRFSFDSEDGLTLYEAQSVQTMGEWP